MFRSAKMVLHCCSDCCICWGIDTRLGGIAPVIVPPRCILLLLEPFYTYRWICTEVCNYGNIHPCVPTNGFSTLADQCFQMHAVLLPRVQFASKLCLISAVQKAAFIPVNVTLLVLWCLMWHHDVLKHMAVKCVLLPSRSGWVWITGLSSSLSCSHRSVLSVNITASISPFLIRSLAKIFNDLGQNRI